MGMIYYVITVTSASVYIFDIIPWIDENDINKSIYKFSDKNEFPSHLLDKITDDIKNSAIISPDLWVIHDEEIFTLFSLTWGNYIL